MPRLTHRNPSYRRHRPSGQAVCTINGRDVYLGPFGTKASRAEYDRVIGEWLASCRRAPVDAATDVSIAELIEAYWQHATTYYIKGGAPTSEVHLLKAAFGPLVRLYGTTSAGAFGPLALEAVRNDMIGRGWCRKTINGHVERIRRAFRWAAGKELVPGGVLHSLEAIVGLRSGRSAARETGPVQPVSDALFEQTLVHVTPTLQALLTALRLSGARVGELCAMRIGDLDRTADVWTYRVQGHKTEHHGHSRTICFGPRAQALLTPFVRKTDPQAFVFSAAQSMREMRERRHADRKTPPGQGNCVGTSRQRRPKRLPREFLTPCAVNRAVARACERAFPLPPGLTEDEAARWRAEHTWHTHQLRHSAATEIRKRFDIDAARSVLGHAGADVTEVYAQRDRGIAERVAAAIG